MKDSPMLTESRKAAWQAIVALANVDGEVEPQEKVVLLDYIRANNFPKDFEAQLVASIDNPMDFSACYDSITDLRDRAHVINVALVVFHADADFEEAEEKLFRLIGDKQRQQVDYTAASNKAREYIKQFQTDYTKAREAERKSSSRMERFFDSINDMLDSDWDLDG